MSQFLCLVLPLLAAVVVKAQYKEGNTAHISTNKTVVTFPETKEGEIAIQTANSQFEVLGFILEQDHAYARSCETEIKKRCKAEDLKEVLSKTQKDIADRCAELSGESRIARRFGVKRISSVCYFKEDKSFVEIY